MSSTGDPLFHVGRMGTSKLLLAKPKKARASDHHVVSASIAPSSVIGRLSPSGDSVYSHSVSEYSGNSPTSGDYLEPSEVIPPFPTPPDPCIVGHEEKPVVVLNLLQFKAPGNFYATIDEDMKTIIVLPQMAMENDSPQLAEIWWNSRQEQWFARVRSSSYCVLNLRDAVNHFLLQSSVTADYRSMVYSRICATAQDMCPEDDPSPIPYDPSAGAVPVISTDELFQEWWTAKTWNEQGRLMQILQSRFLTVAEFQAEYNSTPYQVGTRRLPSKTCQ